ncbi:MAG TPA: hypothetical protein VMD03_09265 [Steroidobacteraceae bacterium]|nr:hypothetical protein [Steroidobacteraceae bacterium]
MDDGTTQIALLAQAAQRQQQQAQVAIERLAALAQGLDQIVRQEIRSALVEEFQALGSASRGATEALEAVRRTASARVGLWTLGVLLACSTIPIAIAWTVLPSRAELAGMRAERDRLAANIALLERSGGHIDLRRCGPTNRLCVRIERAAPPFGAQADYLVVKGY